jgi:hypothetical protein
MEAFLLVLLLVKLFLVEYDEFWRKDHQPESELSATEEEPVG